MTEQPLADGTRPFASGPARRIARRSGPEIGVAPHGRG